MCGLDGVDILLCDRITGGGDRRSMKLYSRKSIAAEFRSNSKKKPISEGQFKRFQDWLQETNSDVFTHGHLNTSNIFVEDRQVTSIVGLDRAAIFPAWAGFLPDHSRWGAPEHEWGALLCKHIDKYCNAKSLLDLCAE
ncbi:hypothetical protein BJ170DRAFT_2105 [Xylariales sp. AK1849]|nr:hypothetical protein BJ170DRAFT_2105 [Xylariales sp. AK1849]